MDKKKSATSVAAGVAFILGAFEFGLVSEGLVWAVEDFLHTSHRAHLIAAAITGLLTLAFAFYAARAAIRLRASEWDDEDIQGTS